jgi:cyanophycin synthetase
MFAAAIAYSMKVGLDDIRQGLRTFDNTYFQAPGRLNIYNEHPFKVILDYAHNPHAVKAIVHLIDNLETEGRRICVLAAPGDRRDEDIHEIATLCAGHFDHYVCRRDDNLRGRDPEDVPRRLRDALLAGGVDEAAVQVIPDEREAVAAGLAAAAPGDLLLVMGDNIRRCWKQITSFSPELDVAASEPEPEASPARGSLDLPDLDLPPIDRLVRDERGVRLAREHEDD